MSGVTLICGDRSFEWSEAPPIFQTTAGTVVLRWIRRGLRHVDERGHRFYEYNLASAETARR